MTEVVLQTTIPGLPVRRGKVRDVYDLGDKLAIVASDRISVFDVILPTGIPMKGKVLTRISAFWFEWLAGRIEHHLETLVMSAGDLPEPMRGHADTLIGRTIIVPKAEVVPVECVVRGYLAGSGWKDYQKTGHVCGIALPEGLRQCDKLPEPIFTPATKAEKGEHDENIDFDRAAKLCPDGVMATLRDRTLDIYKTASDYARDRGVIIADTKLEWGRVGEKHLLIDEVLTPDSSRFWPADKYAPGRDQDSFDKQPVRDFTESLGWNKTAPGPELPPEVVSRTTERYIEAYEKLTGRKFQG
ncbi:MAG: phosphoribosylaminoimidazolesuccinocarboxamide synthase [Phycisphaerae bacterium]|nr:phosphoribosylaminoimidazolesuccinocarboxamide synthase [Phycisphaerae bacterium]